VELWETGGSGVVGNWRKWSFGTTGGSGVVGNWKKGVVSKHKESIQQLVRKFKQPEEIINRNNLDVFLSPIPSAIRTRVVFRSSQGFARSAF
jgi:hypothetical protein